MSAHACEECMFKLSFRWRLQEEALEMKPNDKKERVLGMCGEASLQGEIIMVSAKTWKWEQAWWVPWQKEGQSDSSMASDAGCNLGNITGPDPTVLYKSWGGVWISNFRTFGKFPARRWYVHFVCLVEKWLGSGSK